MIEELIVTLLEYRPDLKSAMPIHSEKFLASIVRNLIKTSANSNDSMEELAGLPPATDDFLQSKVQSDVRFSPHLFAGFDKPALSAPNLSLTEALLDPAHPPATRNAPNSIRLVSKQPASINESETEIISQEKVGHPGSTNIKISKQSYRQTHAKGPVARDSDED